MPGVWVFHVLCWRPVLGHLPRGVVNSEVLSKARVPRLCDYDLGHPVVFEAPELRPLEINLHDIQQCLRLRPNSAIIHRTLAEGSRRSENPIPSGINPGLVKLQSDHIPCRGETRQSVCVVVCGQVFTAQPMRQRGERRGVDYVPGEGYVA